MFTLEATVPRELPTRLSSKLAEVSSPSGSLVPTMEPGGVEVTLAKARWEVNSGSSL
jgi:hypothetical protein